jgi:DNA-3-methyladenine glycosylase II
MKEAIDHLTAVDPIFNSIIEKYGVPVIPERPQGLETLVLLILEQQVSIDSAKATFLKLREEIKSSTLLYLWIYRIRNLGVLA